MVITTWSCAATAETEQPAAPNTPIPALTAPKAADNRLIDLAHAATALVAVGQHGVILRSTDGKHWEQRPAPVSAMLTRLRFTDAQHGWALGYDATILHSGDGGANWTLRHRDPSARALYDLAFTDAQHGLAIGGYGQMLETDDGGQRWRTRDNALAQLGMHLNAIVRLGNGTLLVVGERGLIARSSDAGTTWSLLDSPYAGSLFGALPHGERGVLVYGMRGHVYASEDPSAAPIIDFATWDPYARATVSDSARLAALGWRKLDSPVAESLFGATPLADGGALLVGVNGTALRLDRAGALSAIKTPAAETLSNVIVDRGRLLACGRRGISDLGPAP